MTLKIPVAVLISGNGSNLQALVDATRAWDYPARIALVISNKADAYGLSRAVAAGVPTNVLSHKDYPSREAYDTALHEAILSSGAELVCLAGFMRLLTAGFTEQWEGRMLNIHPSLLPAYPGLDVHKRVLAAGEKESGCTVHFVTAEMDAGPIILQERVPVLPGDDEAALAARVHAAEHRIYPQALNLVASGACRMEEGKAILR